jgi:hypothetical protein
MMQCHIPEEGNTQAHGWEIFYKKLDNSSIGKLETDGYFSERNVIKN